MGIGMQELLLILLVVVLFFGAKKLPEIGSGLGRSIQNFKKALSEPEEVDITAHKKNAPVETPAGQTDGQRPAQPENTHPNSHTKV